LLVDEDPELVGRIEEVKSDIEGLGMQITVMNGATRSNVYALKAERPENALRDGVKGDDPMCIFYTRSVHQ